MKFADKRTLDFYVENIYHKASRKLNMLAGLTNQMDLCKRDVLTNAYFKVSSFTAWLFGCFMVVP